MLLNAFNKDDILWGKIVESWRGQIISVFRSPQVILSQSQDKALRRIGELREVGLSVTNVVFHGQSMAFHLILSKHVE